MGFRHVLVVLLVASMVFLLGCNFQTPPSSQDLGQEVAKIDDPDGALKPTSAFVETPTTREERWNALYEDCIEDGGQFIGCYQAEDGVTCVFTTTDYKTPCSDNSECEGYCWAPKDCEFGDEVTGTCSRERTDPVCDYDDSVIGGQCQRTPKKSVHPALDPDFDPEKAFSDCFDFHPDGVDFCIADACRKSPDYPCVISQSVCDELLALENTDNMYGREFSEVAVEHPDGCAVCWAYGPLGLIECSWSPTRPG